jgi:hypothetical protein
MILHPNQFIGLAIILGCSLLKGFYLKAIFIYLVFLTKTDPFLSVIFLVIILKLINWETNFVWILV